MAALYDIGIDENGLGARLGPMLVTAVMARAADESGRAALRKRPRGAARSLLGDSKALVSHGEVALGEAWARAVVARTRRVDTTATREVSPRDSGDLRDRRGLPDSDARAVGAVDPRTSLVRALSLDAPEALEALCPTGLVSQCFPRTTAPLSDEAAIAPLEARVGALLSRLEDKGITITHARAVVVCARRMNDAAAAGKSRFDVDLHSMERLALALSAEAGPGADVRVTCGKVGGYAKYRDAFGPLAGRLCATLEEGAARSAYSFPGLFELAFERDADAGHILVSMASLVGKWLRELLMASIVEHYRVAHRAAAPADAQPLDGASGYHDPVTARFVAATRLVRRERGVPITCFERAARAPS